MTVTTSAPAGAVQQNPDVAWALADLAARQPAIRTRRDYYEGRHRSVLEQGKSSSPLMQAILDDLSDNLCDDVVDESVDRLSILGWSAPQGETTGDDAPSPTDGADLGALAQALWDTNRGDVRAPAVHRDAWMAADAWVIVEDTPKGPRWVLQDPATMGCRYDPSDPDTIQVAYKVWRDGQRYRLNLYYGPTGDRRARLERYATKGLGTDGGVPQARAFTPLLEVTADGEPDDGERGWTRVPVFHFPADEVGRYGRSVLSDVIPLQDLLNKAVADLAVNMEDAALPQRVAIGVTPEYAADGTEKPLRRRSRNPSDMIRIGAKASDVSLEQFDGMDPRPTLEVIQSWRVEIARKGYLPVFSVSSDAAGSVSGLNLLVQEGRQVKRVKRAQRAWGWVWREVMAYMLTLSLSREVDPGDVDLEWGPPETRDEVALWELLALKRSQGVPQRQVLIEGGYAPDEVDDWLEDDAAAQGGRVSLAGPGVASVTMPGVPGGLALPSTPVQPNGATQPVPTA